MTMHRVPRTDRKVTRQSAMIAERIRRLATEKEIPVYAFVEDVAASGGYWLACAADEIYADQSSIVGSIDERPPHMKPPLSAM